jgi:hypothetical protein
MWDAVIWFIVRVPVLSEQMQVVEPRVSMDSKFLTRTIFAAILFAARAITIVTVISRPSGTFATTIPIMKTILVIASYPYINPRTKNKTPYDIAIRDTIFTKRSISILMGVSVELAD